MTENKMKPFLIFQYPEANKKKQQQQQQKQHLL